MLDELEQRIERLSQNLDVTKLTSYQREQLLLRYGSLELRLIKLLQKVEHE